MGSVKKLQFTNLLVMGLSSLLLGTILFSYVTIGCFNPIVVVEEQNGADVEDTEDMEGTLILEADETLATNETDIVEDDSDRARNAANVKKMLQARKIINLEMNLKIVMSWKYLLTKAAQ